MLHLLSPVNRIMGTRKFDENPVSSRLNHDPMKLLGLRRDHLAQYPHPASVGARFVTRHQKRVADDIDECDRSKSPFPELFGAGTAKAYRA
jgi:hypothetical protein